MKATFKVTFLIQRTKLKANGRAPIVTRIIVNGEMTHFSTQQEIEPDRWDSKGNRTLGQTNDEKTINTFLDEIKASLSRHYYDLQASGESISALKLKNKLCSTDERPIKSTMDLFDKFYLWNRKINQDIEVLSKKLDPQTGVYKMPESEYRARKAKKLRQELRELALSNGVPVRS